MESQADEINTDCSAQCKMKSMLTALHKASLPYVSTASDILQRAWAAHRTIVLAAVQLGECSCKDVIVKQ